MERKMYENRGRDFSSIGEVSWRKVFVLRKVFVEAMTIIVETSFVNSALKSGKERERS